MLFLEATSLFTLALAAVHDIELAKIEHRHTLVLAVLLGEDGETTVSDVLGKERTVGGGWLAEATSTLPVPALSHLNATLLKRFTKKFAVKRGAMAAGKLLPAGIGAVIGAGGNRFIGKRIVTNARNAFGEPPTAWPVQLRLVAPDS
ncbi:membrane protein [Mycobacteroides abscessus subsp. abscessus]|nr:membrane protein [Mycobacteroides abscessus subsp. abscessus]